MRQYLDQALAAGDADFSLPADNDKVLSTTYSYDEVGNQLTQVDALGRKTEYRADALGRRLKRILPAATGETTALAEELKPGLDENQKYGQSMDTMVFTEIRPQLEQLSHDERMKALAFIKHLLRAESPEYQEELARRHADMDAGKKVGWTELKKQLGLE